MQAIRIQAKAVRSLVVHTEATVIHYLVKVDRIMAVSRKLVIVISTLGIVTVSNHQVLGTLRILGVTGRIIEVNHIVVVMDTHPALDKHLRFEVDHKLTVIRTMKHLGILPKRQDRLVAASYILDDPEWVVIIIHIRKRVAVGGNLLEADLGLMVGPRMLEVAARTVMVVIDLGEDSLQVAHQQVGLLKQEAVNIVVVDYLVGLVLERQPVVDLKVHLQKKLIH